MVNEEGTPSCAAAAAAAAADAICVDCCGNEKEASEEFCKYQPSNHPPSTQPFSNRKFSHVIDYL